MAARIDRSTARRTVRRMRDRQHFVVRTTRRAFRVIRQELRHWHERRELEPLLAEVQPYTMLPEASLLQLLQLLKDVHTEGLRGDIVECGVWRGGASFLMARQLQRLGTHNRKVWLCDSFEGLPPPEERDGPAALRYAKNTDSPGYVDNCRATLDEVQQGAQSLGLTPNLQFIEGWFDQTLPIHRERIGPIALLHVDCDWYASVRCCLDNLYDQVVPGGIIVFDDYYTWDGCALAVHEFLGTRHLSHRLKSAGNVPAYFHKR